MVHDYYNELLKGYPDALTVQDIVAITGYCDTTVVQWCNAGKLKHFIVRRKFIIPKTSLVEFIASPIYAAIQVKCKRHKEIINDYRAE